MVHCAVGGASARAVGAPLRVRSVGPRSASYHPFRSRRAPSQESSNGTGTFAWTVASSSNEALPTSDSGAALVSNAVNVFSSAWVFTVAPRNGTWVPTWQAGALAGVVLLGAVVAALVLAVAVERGLKTQLLYSMLPRRVVAKMQAGRTDFAEPHAHATVLFSDIVSYTSLAQTKTPGYLMSMLSGMFDAFDVLAAKNGERVPYRRLLPTLLQALAARELPPAASAALELDVLVALEWRLGPFYSAEERAEAAEAASGIEGTEAAPAAACPPTPTPVIAAAAATPPSNLDDNSAKSNAAPGAGHFCWLGGGASRASSLGASSSTCCA